MAFYSFLDSYPGYPYSRNCNGIEITAIGFIYLPQEHIFCICQSPNVSLRQMSQRLHPDWNTSTLVDNLVFSFETLNGNWLKNSERTSFHDLFVKDQRYNQLISCKTTNHKTCIDHIYTNITEQHFKVQILESFVSQFFRFYKSFFTYLVLCLQSAFSMYLNLCVYPSSFNTTLT